MNFFEHQDQARRQTRTLVILFILAVIAIVIAVNAAMALVWLWTKGVRMDGPYGYPRGFFVTNTFVTLALIGGGTAIELFNLREGGDAVAKMAGGRLVAPASTVLLERRLQNVVEEMAIASGIACPKVYVLDREDAINAFAAGYNPNEAVLAVTRGTLQRLTRDELQGVIGHEFSHILNGDMRLNMRLIGVLFGIQMIAGFGQHLMDFARYFVPSRSRSRDDKGPSAALVVFVSGAALFAIGYIGVFFGRLIKSAVSRQREYLADASAVQFTRNRDGIGGALRKIGGLSREMELGSRITHPNAEQLSHLFLGAVKPGLVAGLFATHPPIEERLRRLYGRKVELLDAPVQEEAPQQEPMLPDIPFSTAGFAAAQPAVRSAPLSTQKDNGASMASAIAFGHGAGERTALAPQLDSAVRDPHAACAVVYALLLGQDGQRETQMAALNAADARQGALAAYLADAVAAMPKSARLPLLDLAMPALRQLPQPERDEVLAMAARLIAADKRVTLSEFVLQTVLQRRLDPHAGRAVPVRYPTIGALRQETAVLLSLVAHMAAKCNGETAFAAYTRGANMVDLNDAPSDIALLGSERIRAALMAANELAPLAKPVLIRALVATATAGTQDMPVETADLLRAICAAIDVPLPAIVASTYMQHAWAAAS
ncbi:M48 family metallopeptidase [Noviherbaspirillum sp. UKPF54]|uniref:M48 family metallopeptidase n=1 Tax=Noviherbaspirillum sp. UKPF54 TaxID=2601898 RepID=UPI0011B0FFF8|nr:M48 family metallopeptidase [Noviherbaspirillum sp. UKPF54]QDZ29584.1 peptidase [Noviherbaspirillum sp. UKPF54]